MRDEPYLFWELDWHAATEGQKEGVRAKVNRFGTDDLERGTLDELAEQIADEFALVPPQIDEDNIEVSQREIDVHSVIDSYSVSRSVKGTAIDVRVPFTGDAEMFRVKPSTFDIPPRGRVSKDAVEFTISGVNLTQEQVKSEIDSRVRVILQYLEFQAKSIGAFPEELRRVAYEALEQRKRKLEADRDLISNLGYKFRDKS